MTKIQKLETALPDQVGKIVAPDAALLSRLNINDAGQKLLLEAYQKIADTEEKLAVAEARIRELEDMAATDSMTGLMNRRGFEKFFEQEMSRIRRHQSAGALMVLIDLDRFKPLNDLYGHQAGDAALKLVGETLAKSIRIADGAARFGGDEFALLLTSTDPDKAQVRVNAVRLALNNLVLEWKGELLPFGASLGAAPLCADGGYAGVYQLADKALYADKARRKAMR
ncbi:MAG: GGDEF domain-containing protein [Alphaproteobacteria bacterium]